MRSDENWKETRATAQDMELLTGVPVSITENYLKLLENLILHKFTEQVSTNKDLRGTDCQITLPYLGDLIVSISDNSQLTTSFVVRPSFYKKLIKCYTKKESPLITQISTLVEDEFVRKFNANESGDSLE